MKLTPKETELRSVIADILHTSEEDKGWHLLATTDEIITVAQSFAAYGFAIANGVSHKKAWAGHHRKIRETMSAIFSRKTNP